MYYYEFIIFRLFYIFDLAINFMLKLTAVLLAIMLLAVTATFIDMDQSADAMKATQKGNKRYSGNTGNLVCGDKLCSGPSYIKKIR